MSKINVTVWNENAQAEQYIPYPEKGIHGEIAGFLSERPEFSVKTATLDQPGQGFTDELIDTTDVLVWWGHLKHADVSNELVAKLKKRVLGGMGLIALHSSHYAKLFTSLLGSSCSLYAGPEMKEILWTLDPAHEIARGVPAKVEFTDEVYGERFDIPEPDRLVFASWFEQGQLFRSGAVFYRGNGRIFYFQPGHETLPVYRDEHIRRIITNAVFWAANKQ